MGVFVWVAKGAACVSTWPPALFKVRSLLIEKEGKFEEKTKETLWDGGEKLVLTGTLEGAWHIFLEEEAVGGRLGSEEQSSLDGRTL